MEYPATGLHQITACAAGAQEHIKFFTQVVGQRLIKDRNYFHSIYVRSPGGILVECTATAAGGFAKDEPFNQLGTHLLLPPWLEHRREEILGMLEPIKVPEWHTPVAAPRITASRRTKATFIPADEGVLVQ